MLHLVFVRSQVAHARIRSIDTSKAKAMPGVVAVITGEDIKDQIAPLPQAVYDAALAMARDAHRALGCRGVSRADFRWDDSKPGSAGLYLLEVNTQPGMTPLSLVPEQAAYCGIDFPALVSWMVEHARCDG